MKLPIKPRTLVMVLVFGALLATGALLYRAGALSADTINGLLESLGHWALPAYVALFIVGTLLQVPGMVFVVVAPLAFGPTLGFAAAYLGAVMAVTLSFLLVRLARGKQAEPRQLPLRWAQKLLDRAEKRPILSVILLRLVFFLSPPLNVGLGFSTLKTRDYVVGSAVGIIAPLGVVICGIGLV